MASVEESLVALLQSEPTITALIGSTPMRLYPDAIPQGATLPAVAYQRVSTPRDWALAGTDSVSFTRIQLTVWAPGALIRSAVSKAIHDFIRKANTEWRQHTRDRYINGVRFGGITIDNEINQREPNSTTAQAIIDLIIAHNEPA